MGQTVSVELAVIDNLVKNTEGISRRFGEQLKAMEASVARLDNSMSKSEGIANSLRTAYAGIASIAGGLVVREMLKAGEQVEDLSTQFKVLLGSTDAAKGRMAELARFAADTPFELGEVSEASRTLEIFTKGTFSTGDALRKVGDAAAGTGNSFKDVAFWIGRLYSGLQQGTPIGEESMRLSEMAVLSGEARRKLQDLSEAHAPLRDSLKVLDGEFARFNGSMDAMSRTVSGRASTAMDNLRESVRQVLAGGAWDRLNQGLSNFNATIEKMNSDGTFKHLGEDISTVITLGENFFVVYAGAKILTIAKNFDAAAFAATGFGRAMTFLAANPIFAAAAGLGLVINLLADDMDKAATKMGNVDWMKDPAKVKEAIDLTDRYASILKDQMNPALSSSGFAWSGYQKQLDAVNDSFRQITGRSVQEFKDTFGDKVLQSQLNALSKIKELKEKAEQNKPKAPSAPNQDEGDGYSVRLLSRAEAAERQKGRVVDMLEVSAKAYEKDFHRSKLLADHEAQLKDDKKKSTHDWLLNELKALDQLSQAEIDKFVQEQNLAKAKRVLDLQDIEMQDFKNQAIVQSLQNMGDAIGAFAGKSKGLFLFMQGLAASEIAINMWRSVMSDNILAPYKVPYDFALGATAEAAVLARTIAGFERGGYTGPGSSRDVAGLVHRDEYVVPSSALRALGGPQGVEAALAGGPRMDVGGIHIVLQGTADAASGRMVAQQVNRSLRGLMRDLERAQRRNTR